MILHKKSAQVRFIIYSDDHVIEVYDQLGRKIHSDRIANTESRATTISMNGYEPGAYIVRCITGEIQKSFKLVKL